jgi:sec-independent protein translocase protein TatA
MGVGPGELLVVLVVVAVIFGPSRLPELARSAGRTVRAFKDGIADTRMDRAPSGSPQERDNHS